MRLAVLLLLLSSSALANPFGPGTEVPGLGREESRMLYAEASRLVNESLKKFGPKLGASALSPRATICALAQFGQGVIEASAFHQRGRLTPDMVTRAGKALDYLRDVQRQ
ncbi:MAG TPA: hypothetical protein VFY54_12205, partial [Rubrobacter sp.]|nr:hypothetical protein [Rubrobacter sp.]